MIRRKFPVLLTMASVVVALTCGSGQASAKDPKPKNKVEAKRLEQQAIRAAAKAARARGQRPGIAGLAAPGVQAVQVPDPGGVPHYFGPYGNWAFSPLPKGPVATVTLVDGGTGYNNPLVTVDDAYLPTAAITTPATVTATAVGGVITGFTIVN